MQDKGDESPHRHHVVLILTCLVFAVISVNGNNVSGSPPFWKKGEGTIRVEFAKSWQ